MSFKFCISCVWSEGAARHNPPEGSFKCTNPAVVGYNLVTGILNSVSCTTARGADNPCGLTGNNYKPVEE